MPNNENKTPGGEQPAEIIPINPEFPLSYQNWNFDNFKQHLGYEGSAEAWYKFVTQLWKYKNYVYDEYV